MRHLKRQLTPANVLSCVALFVALSGAAYAATAALPKKSVKTRHLAKGLVTTQKLRNGAVTAAKLRNGAVTGTKIAPGAVGSSQLADGSVRSADLGGGVVTTPKLKNGAVTGEKIANGAVTNSKLGTDSVTAGKIQEGAVTASKLAPGFNAQLVKNVSYVTKTSPLVFPSDSAEVTAECPVGKQAIAGGAGISLDTNKVALVESGPVVDGAGKRTGWSAAAAEFDEEAADWSLEVTAICAEF
jgi:hypothetical protein